MFGVYSTSEWKLLNLYCILEGKSEQTRSWKKENQNEESEVFPTMRNPILLCGPHAKTMRKLDPNVAEDKIVQENHIFVLRPFI